MPAEQSQEAFHPAVATPAHRAYTPNGKRSFDMSTAATGNTKAKAAIAMGPILISNFGFFRDQRAFPQPPFFFKNVEQRHRDRHDDRTHKQADQTERPYATEQ